MKVHELIEALAAFDPELEVMVNGYEGGTQTLYPYSLRLRRVQPTPDAEWWDGDHGFVRDGGQEILLISRVVDGRGGSSEN